MRARIILLFIIVFAKTHAQELGADTLILMGGDKIAAFIDSVTEDKVYFKKLKKGNKYGKQKSKKNENVFRVVYNNGDVNQIYKQDSILDEFLTIEEMEFYIKGLRDGTKHKKPWVLTVLGVGVGATGGYFGVFWGLVPTGLYPAATGLITSDNVATDDKNLLLNEYYMSGYLTAKKRNQMKYGAIGSVIGLVGSIPVYQYLSNTGEL